MKSPACGKALGVLLSLLVSSVVSSQQSRVDPAINERYKDPDLDDLVTRLEREGRSVYKYRHAIVAALGLDAGDDVADVGAGTGFLTRLIARQVAPEGRVYAVEIAQKTLNLIKEAAREEGITNIEGILGGDKTTHLPSNSVDLVFICDTYHHFEYPVEIMASIAQALRPEGQLVVVDYERIRGLTPESMYEHLRAGKGTFTDEIKDAGFTLEKDLPLVPENYYLVFRKRAR